MRKKLLFYLGGWAGVLIFSNQVYFILYSSSHEIMESLVFDPFTWFIAVLFFVIGMLSISKLIFYSLFPHVKMFEKLIYGFSFLTMIILYRGPATVIILTAILYAILEVNDYTKKLRKYRERG